MLERLRFTMGFLATIPLLQALIFGQVVAGSPSASPVAGDGLVVVYQAETGRGEADAIYVANQNDGSVIEVSAAAAGSNKHPDWSPDGGRIVFVSDANGELWTVDANGTDASLLYACDASCTYADFPAWSPDGTRIAFTAYEWRAGWEGPPEAASIRILDLATMETIEVVRSELPRLVDVPRWSPDGTSLVIGVDEFDADFNEQGSAIATVPVAGGELRYLTDFDQFAYYPDWNPDGQVIVFSIETVRYSIDPLSLGSAGNLYTITPEGANLQTVSAATEGQFLHQPSWLPDGSAIIATLDDESGRRAVLVDPVTGGIEQLDERFTSHTRVQP